MLSELTSTNAVRGARQRVFKNSEIVSMYICQRFFERQYCHPDLKADRNIRLAEQYQQAR
jgi:hypothetical protein